MKHITSKLFILLFSFIMIAVMLNVVNASLVLWEYDNISGSGGSGFYGNNWLAQTFTVGSTAHNVTSIKLNISRIGSPSIFNVSIRATSGGLPSGLDLTSNVTNPSFIPGNDYLYHWIEIQMPKYALSANTLYAIVLRCNGDSSNELSWRIGSAYAGGQNYGSADGGSTWSGLSQDFMFEIWDYEDTPPVYSNVGTNTTQAGQPCLFSTKWTAGTGENISGYIFGTNNTGSWVNDTWVNLGSDANVEWSNVTKTLNITVGVTVQWQIWANSTSSTTWGATGIRSLVTTGQWHFVESWTGTMRAPYLYVVETWNGIFPFSYMYFIRMVFAVVGLGGMASSPTLIVWSAKKRNIYLALTALSVILISFIFLAVFASTVNVEV